MEVSTKNVVEKIKVDYDDVAEFDDLVDAWNSLCAQTADSNDSELQFADIEKAAIAALSEAPADRATGKVGNEVSRMINGFDYPVYLVTSQGMVATGNLAAWREFRIDAGDSIDQLPFFLDGPESLSQVCLLYTSPSPRDS